MNGPVRSALTLVTFRGRYLRLAEGQCKRKSRLRVRLHGLHESRGSQALVQRCHEDSRWPRPCSEGREASVEKIKRCNSRLGKLGLNV